MDFDFEYENVNHFNKKYSPQIFSEVDKRGSLISSFVETYLVLEDINSYESKNFNFFGKSVSIDQNISKGILVFVHKSVVVEKVFISDKYDLVILDCVLEEKQFIIAVVYIPESFYYSGAYVDFFNALKEKLQGSSLPISLCGDFNFKTDFGVERLPQRRNRTSRYKAEVFNHIYDFLAELNFRQVNKVKKTCFKSIFIFSLCCNSFCILQFSFSKK